MDFRTPGQLINSLLKSKGWNQRVLAIVLGMDETGINRLVLDKRPVTAELAVVLEEVLGVPAEQLLTLQKEYDLKMARIKVIPDNGRNTRAQLFGGLPVAEMIKRGWIQADSVRDVPAVEASLSKFFGVMSPDEIEILPHAAKKTDVIGEVTPTQLAWLYRVRQIANNMLTARYTPATVRSSILKLTALLAAPEEARKVPRILAESGIRFVIVESLPSSKIDGVCFWLNESRPVIGMSLRHDRIDNFWFVLRHELEHVIQLHGRTDGRATVMLDTELEEKIAASTTNIPKEENIANQAAADFCVPKKSMDSFIARKSPLFTERDVIGFSRTLNLHPGLIVGQLQHHTGRYELFRKYLVKIKDIVAPNAIVDGWGDIAPIEI
jgi:HTH-type transcriptional regulator/antitoxin HigA